MQQQNANMDFIQASFRDNQSIQPYLLVNKKPSFETPTKPFSPIECKCFSNYSNWASTRKPISRDRSGNSIQVKGKKQSQYESPRG